MSLSLIDIHAHILPGLDDGADTMEEALEMAQMAVESGVHIMVATPHSPSERRIGGAASMVEARVRELQYRLRCEHIPLRVLPGMEIMASESTATFLAQGHLLPLAGTRYVLLEFDFAASPDYISHVLRGVLRANFVPVVAHPERYFCVQDLPEEALFWKKSGCLLQLNKGSLLGEFGDEPQEAARWLLRQNGVFTVSSDAHSSYHRNTDMAAVWQTTAELTSPDTARKLLAENPLRLLTDEPISAL